jgi:hypothetical protein
MKTRHIIIASLALFTCATMQAAQVSENAARSIAAQFMQQHGMGVIATSAPLMAPRQGDAEVTTAATPAYYVFNAQPGHGFVIVSGDSRTEQVLGYSDKGSFDSNNVPKTVQCWLNQYAAEIDMLDKGVVEPSATSAPKAGITPVAPFIKTHWGQDNPFNLECPQLGGKYCKTGSLATALAQVMYYARYKPNDYFHTTLNGYTTSTHKLQVGAYMKMVYWDDVLTDYTTQLDNPYNTQNIAVARLMRFCAQATKTDFDTTYSVGMPYIEPLENFLYFPKAARMVYRTDYSKAEWENYILIELNNKRPVIYTARDYTGITESFVCDGHDGNGYYHFNWGLQGEYDGYYRLTLVNHDANTANFVPSGYTITQRIMIGLKYDSSTSQEQNSVAFANSVAIGQETYTRDSSSDAFVINVTASQRCNPISGRTYDMGWGVYQEDGYSLITRYTGAVQDTTLSPNQTIQYRRNLSFGKGYSDGTYYLRPICRETGNSHWYPSHHSGNNRYIRAVINGNTITLSTPPGAMDPPEGVRVWISSVSDIKKVGRPIELTVQIVNESHFGDCIPIYLYEYNRLIGGTEVKVPIGTSTSTKMVFVPTRAVTFPYALVPRDDFYEPSYEPSYAQRYCEQFITIESTTAGDLSITDRVTNADANNVITGNSMMVQATVKNNYSFAYHDFIVAKLYKNGAGHIQSLWNGINVAGNGTTTTNFTFDNLEPGTYHVTTHYYRGSNLLSLSGGTPDCQVGFLRGDVNGDGKVNVSDVSALINMIMGITAMDQSAADVNGDGRVNVSDVSALINIILGIQ